MKAFIALLPLALLLPLTAHADSDGPYYPRDSDSSSPYPQASTAPDSISAAQAALHKLADGKPDDSGPYSQGDTTPAALAADKTAAQADPFVFAPAYMLPAGAGAIEGSISYSNASQGFSNSSGSGEVKYPTLLEGLNAHYGLTGRDDISAGLSYASIERNDLSYTNGPSFNNDVGRKLDPSLGYEHLFSDRSSDYKYSAFLNVAQLNERPGTLLLQPGLNGQLRWSRDLLLFGSIAYNDPLSDQFVPAINTGLGLEWQALPLVSFGLDGQVSTLTAQSGSTGNHSTSVGVFTHIAFGPRRYLSLALNNISTGSYSANGNQYSGISNGTQVSATLYIGF